MFICSLLWAPDRDIPMEAGSGMNIRHCWAEREGQFQALCWQKLNHSSFFVCCVRQGYQNPPQPSLSCFCDPGGEDLIKLRLMPHSFAQRVCSASAKSYSSNSQIKVLLTSASIDGSCRPSSSSSSSRRLLGMVGDREPRGSLHWAQWTKQSLNFSRSKLNWETKEEKLNRVGVDAPELSSTEGAFLLHSFSLWLLCKQCSGCVFLAQSTESYDSWL